LEFQDFFPEITLNIGQQGFAMRISAIEIKHFKGLAKGVWVELQRAARFRGVDQILVCSTRVVP
jgi:hypothetical protein